MYCGAILPEALRLDPKEATVKIKAKESARIHEREDQQKQADGEWGYKQYREAGGYEDDDGWGT